MKKIIMLTALSLFLLPATQSFADSAAEPLKNGVGAKLGFNASNSVDLLYGNQAVAKPQAYVAMAKHEGGDRVYGTTANSNLLVTEKSDDCKGLQTLACFGKLTTTPDTLTGDDNGDDNVDGLTGWSNY